jgi:hypothetical protein
VATAMRPANAEDLQVRRKRRQGRPSEQVSHTKNLQGTATSPSSDEERN